jgi:tRNA-specific 2-thiouridylase
LKFDQLLVTARQIGADRLATGHYARVAFDEASGRWQLKRPADTSKDQTYFLFGLTQEQLSRTIFPLGGMTKPQVRDLARQHGLTIGEHSGVHQFTVGQRKGLGVATGSPLYVIELRGDKGQVVVGSGEELMSKSLRARDLNLITVAELTGPRRITCKIRNRHEGAPALLEKIGDDEVLVTFDQPQRAVTPGQAAVFYDGDLVLGGGWIA